MDEYFIGQIVMAVFQRQMRNFMPCDGRLLQIRNYNALFALIGTQYGGDGVQTFGLPDLRGVAPFGTDYTALTMGSRYPEKYQAGSSQPAVSTTITQSNLPPLQAQVTTPKTTVPLQVKATTSNIGQNTPADKSVLCAATSGSGGANIYATAPLGATDPLVTLDGGSIDIPASTSTVTIPGGGAALKLPIPSQVVCFQICVMGIFPSFE